MIRGRALRLTAIPVLTLTVLSACYQYVPATTESLMPGAEYRGHLSDEGSQQVARLLGQNVARFDGRLIGVQDTAYLVSMGATLRRSEDRPTIWTGEQLVIPRSAVTRFEMRQLDRPRTIRAAALYALGAAGIGLLIFSVQSTVGGSGVVAPPPPPP